MTENDKMLNQGGANGQGKAPPSDQKGEPSQVNMTK